MTLAFSPVLYQPVAPAMLSPVVERPDRRLSFRRRLCAYICRPRLGGSLRRALLTLVREWLVAQAANLREWCSSEPRLLQTWTGDDNLAKARSVAIYIHYVAAGGVSEMVIRQIEEYRAQGFTIVFVSMCPKLQDRDLTRLRRITGLILWRRNFSLDFGAWHDVAPLLRTLAPAMTELLLVNDSVCGPLCRLDGVINSMRACGEGLFGLTENLAPRPHLQSYFLVARGTTVVSDTLRFLELFRPTAYKRAVIRYGEVRLSSWMRKRGHLVAAVHGYETVEHLALQRPRALDRLQILFPTLVKSGTRANWTQALQHFPLNPTHSLWYELVECCNFPFVKIDLLVRNPIGVPDTADWRELVSPARRELLPLIEDHLWQMTRGKW
jgi:Rhamnan synthesis protein F